MAVLFFDAYYFCSLSLSLSRISRIFSETGSGVRLDMQILIWVRQKATLKYRVHVVTWILHKKKA